MKKAMRTKTKHPKTRRMRLLPENAEASEEGEPTSSLKHERQRSGKFGELQDEMPSQLMASRPIIN